MIKKLIRKVKKLISKDSKKSKTFPKIIKKKKDGGYVGVPAPAYLEIDPWFSPPVLSKKQMTYKEAHDKAIEEKQILDESETKESADIHQKLYEMSSKNWTTVLESQGGSENFQEDNVRWNSGTGMRQFK